jgi:hypothetical protein
VASFQEVKFRLQGRFVTAAALHRYAPAATRREIASLRSRAELEAFARARGYATGWVLRILAARARRGWAS